MPMYDYYVLHSKSLSLSVVGVRCMSKKQGGSQEFSIDGCEGEGGQAEGAGRCEWKCEPGRRGVGRIVVGSAGVWVSVEII